jgi:hypothetical protein
MKFSVAGIVAFQTLSMLGIADAATADFYIGCYLDASSRDMTYQFSYSGGLTIQKCITGCGGAGYMFAGLQNTNQCFCDNTYGSYGTSTNCIEYCNSNNGEICGGPWANSVYLTGPTPEPTKTPSNMPSNMPSQSSEPSSTPSESKMPSLSSEPSSTPSGIFELIGSFELTILTDDFPKDIVWEVIDECSNDNVVFSGGPYTEKRFSYVEIKNLPFSQYRLTITDTEKYG